MEEDGCLILEAHFSRSGEVNLPTPYGEMHQHYGAEGRLLERHRLLGGNTQHDGRRKVAGRCPGVYLLLKCLDQPR